MLRSSRCGGRARFAAFLSTAKIFVYHAFGDDNELMGIRRFFFLLARGTNDVRGIAGMYVAIVAKAISIDG